MFIPVGTAQLSFSGSDPFHKMAKINCVGPGCREGGLFFRGGAYC